MTYDLHQLQKPTRVPHQVHVYANSSIIIIASYSNVLLVVLLRAKIVVQRAQSLPHHR